MPGSGRGKSNRAKAPSTAGCAPASSAITNNEVSRTFVRTMVESGNTLFIRDLERFGGWARWDRRNDWLTQQEPRLLRALFD